MTQPQVLNLSEDGHEVLTALIRAIRLSDGFTLLFVKCNLPAQKMALLSVLKREFPESLIAVVNEPIEDLHAGLTEALPQPPAKFPVFVVDYERSIAFGSPERETLQVLNTARESLKKVHAGPLVFWLPDYALTEIARFAPDLWAWRSGVYEFQSNANFFDKRSFDERHWSEMDQTLLMWPLRERIYQKLEIQQQIKDLAEAEKAKSRPYLEAGLYYRLARLERSLREREQAQQHFEHALKLYSGLKAIQGIIRCWQELGMLMLEQDKYAEAQQFFSQGLAEARQQSDTAPVLHLLYHLSLVQTALKQYHEAESLIQEAYDLSLQAQDHEMTGLALLEQGRIASFQHNWDKAEACLNEARELMHKSGALKGESSALYRLGWLHQERGHAKEALSFFRLALGLSEQLNDPFDTALTWFQIAVQEFALGALEDAKVSFEQAVKFAHIADPELEEQFLRQLAERFRELGELELALAFERRLQALKIESPPNLQGSPEFK